MTTHKSYEEQINERLEAISHAILNMRLPHRQDTTTDKFSVAMLHEDGTWEQKDVEVPHDLYDPAACECTWMVRVEEWVLGNLAHRKVVAVRILQELL